MNSGETFGWESHGGFELIIPLQNIWLRFPPPEGFPIHGPAHPGEMSMDGDWVIASMHDALEEGRLKAMFGVSSSDRHVKGAVVAIEVGKFADHFREYVEIFRIKEAAFSAAMGGDHFHAAFQREGEDPRVREFLADYGHGMFASGVSE